MSIEKQMDSKTLLNFVRLYALILVLPIKCFSQDSVQVFFNNPYFVDHLEIYRYKSRDTSILITSLDAGYVNRYIKFTGKTDTNFWIYRKNRLWFTGRWIAINAGYKHGRTLLIQYSKERKRRYCYEYLWIEGSLPLKLNKM